MTHLFDELPRGIAVKVRRKVMACFTCSTYFYHSRKNLRLITPEEQKAIARVFHNTGTGIVPKYDDYVDKMHW